MRSSKRDEFLRAYDKYAQAIYRHCFFRVHSKVRAEEIVQETFLRMWEYLNKEKKIENMQAFLYRISRNIIIDSARKMTVRGKREESLDSLMAEMSRFEPSYDGRRELERAVLFREILEVIQRMSKDYQEVLLMRYVEDLEPKEIAKILGTNPHNISVKINRATKALKNRINVPQKTESV